MWEREKDAIRVKRKAVKERKMGGNMFNLKPIHFPVVFTARCMHGIGPEVKEHSSRQLGGE